MAAEQDLAEPDCRKRSCCVMAAASRWQRTGYETAPLISNQRVTLVDYRCSGCGERRGVDSNLEHETVKRMLKEMKCNCK